MSETEGAGERPSGTDAPILPGASARALLTEARRLRESGSRVLGAADERRQAARHAYEAARDEVVAQQLATMPIARLRETTEDGVRLGAIEAAGFSTVGKVLITSPQRLMQIRGVGSHSVVQVIAAARQLHQAVKDGLWLRIEADRSATRIGRLNPGR